MTPTQFVALVALGGFGVVFGLWFTLRINGLWVPVFRKGYSQTYGDQ